MILTVGCGSAWTMQTSWASNPSPECTQDFSTAMSGGSAKTSREKEKDEVENANLWVSYSVNSISDSQSNAQLSSHLIYLIADHKLFLALYSQHFFVLFQIYQPGFLFIDPHSDKLASFSFHLGNFLKANWRDGIFSGQISHPFRLPSRKVHP